MIARSLGCRIRRVGIVFRFLQEKLGAEGQMMLGRRSSGGEGRLYALGVGQLKRAIHLVGGNMIEQLAIIAAGGRFPVDLGCLEAATGYP